MIECNLSFLQIWYKSCIMQSRISAYTGTKPLNHGTIEAASSFCGLSSLASKLDAVIFLLDSGAQKTQNLPNRVLFFCQIWYRMTKSHLGLFGLKGETHDEFGPGGNCYGAFRLTTPLSELPKKNRSFPTMPPGFIVARAWQHPGTPVTTKYLRLVLRNSRASW